MKRAPGRDSFAARTATGPSYIYRLHHDEITHAEFTPEDFDVAWALVTMLRDTGDRAATERLLAELQAQFPGNPQLAALAESLR